MQTIRTIIIFSAITLIMGMKAGAQDEVVFPLETGSWAFMRLAYNTETSSYSASCYSYTSIGDTTFNGKAYQTIWNEYLGEPGYFRQEGQKVFYVPDPEIYAWNGDANEYTVYNFSLNDGDITWLYGFTQSQVDSAEATVLAVDSVAIDTVQMRKKIGFGDILQDLPYSGCSLTWIEGIGQADYLPFYFWPSENMCVTADYQTLFDCLTIGGENVYGPCNCIGFTGVEEVVNVSLGITPNPTSGKFTVDQISGEVLDIAVFNKLGILVKRSKTGTVDLTNYPAGVYYLVAFSKGYRYTGKVVKF
ncbi:MAG: T9SS type A sorting domain-containing protein [Saprospiraceae bacterium]|nr:T9SS type A sorting domain-containing protein [Saprospiraceae bacterium]MCB9325221.1 T9SS type A sorting domain-containing protein [Lewinellaceae bacterium]